MNRTIVASGVELTLSCMLAGCQPAAPADSPAAASDAASAPTASVASSEQAQPAVAAATALPPAGTLPEPARLVRITRLSQATRAERDHFLYLPKGYDASSDRRWPVLLFLHGNGERGDAKADLDYLLKNGPLYEAWIQKRDLPFIIVAPQLPMYGMDAKADYLKQRTRAEIPARLAQGVPERPKEFATPEAMRGAVAQDLPAGSTAYGPPMGWPELESDLIAILDDVLAMHHGDPSRQYLSGVSYGGFGTWYLASRHPERFAAIVPVVGYAHPDLIPPLAAAKLPIWCFAGGRDNAVELQYFYAGLNRLEALGHDGFRFTVEADMGHDVWARVYAGKDVYDWMLSHQRLAPPGGSASPPGKR